MFDAASVAAVTATDASIYQVDAGGRGGAAHGRGRAHRDADRGRGGGGPSCRAAPAPRNAARPSGAALVIDNSKVPQRTPPRTMQRPARAEISVQPGMVLDRLNAKLKSARPLVPGRCINVRPGHASAAWRETTPAARAPSAYGNMVHNVLPPSRRCLADGSVERFDEIPVKGVKHRSANATTGLVEGRAGHLRSARPRTRSLRRFPTAPAARGPGYNLDMVSPHAIRSTTTRCCPTSRTCWSVPRARLAVTRQLAGTEALAAAETTRCWAWCSFPDVLPVRWTCTQHIVKLGPDGGGAGWTATMIDLARGNSTVFLSRHRRGTLVGEPEAILLVEFSGEDTRSRGQAQVCDELDQNSWATSDCPASSCKMIGRPRFKSATCGRCARPASTS